MRRTSFLHLALLVSLMPLAIVAGTVQTASARYQQTDSTTPPVLNITYETETGYDVKGPIDPGWYIVTLKNNSEADVVADLVMLPPDQDVAALQQGVTTASGGSTVPDWFETVTFAGGPWAKAGSTGQTLVLLTTGTWQVLEVGNMNSNVATLSVVDGPAPDQVPAPGQRVDVAMAPGSFTMQAQVPTGNWIWHVTNSDTLTHAFALVLLPSEISYDEMSTMLKTGQVPKDVKLDEAATVGGIGLLSGGRAIWTVYDLNPGYYVALDYVPIKDGRTYAELGQFAMFIVK